MHNSCTPIDGPADHGHAGRIYNDGIWCAGTMRFHRSICAICLLGLMVTAVAQPQPARSVTITVVDEVGAPVASAQITVLENGRSKTSLRTDYAGRASLVVSGAAFTLRVLKPGFYQGEVEQSDPKLREVQIVLHHEQIVTEQVKVTASPPGIDKGQVSDRAVMNVPEITNVPYPTSRDIRNLLPFYPGVVQDESGQVHVAGSETWAALDLLDGFDIRSPVSGNLALRVSADAVRSIEQESTRYPVQYGRNTGGVIALYTGMGDNKYRFNATNFVPSFQQKNGIRFDKFVPRFTFSGPLERDRAWFFDGLELEYDNVYISELPANADTNHVLRGSNLLKFQANVTPSNIVSAGVLTNEYHSLYDGLSSLIPQQSATKRNTVAWMPYVRNQHSFHHGALLDAGVSVLRIRDGFDPHGNEPFSITPEQTLGSYFESMTGHSQRIEANSLLYLSPGHWNGQHDVRVGVDANLVRFDQRQSLTPVNYLRENRTLLRRSTFTAAGPIARHNVELGAFAQDRWTLPNGLLIEPGLRFDWDQVIRRPLFSPRLAATYSPARFGGRTKVSAGIGLYYDHTQLEYLMRAFVGTRTDQYFGPDGGTPQGPALATNFVVNYGALREARAVNWSVGLEQGLPGGVIARANVLQKRVTDEFAYVNVSDPGGVAGTYRLGSSREDHDEFFEVDARRTFGSGYAIFGAYTHSRAHSNAAIDYTSTISDYGPQQSGPLRWDTPNRVLSWGWAPFAVPYFRKNWDFVYTLNWRDGFPYTSVNADQQVVGVAGGRRFPNYTAFSPGLEWRFHFRGAHFGLRAVLENITGSRNPAIVNRVVDSPQYGTFSEFDGRALTARIRLISSGR